MDVTVDEDLRYGPRAGSVRRPVLVLAGAPLLVLAAAVVVGAVVGWAVGALLVRSASGTDGWAELGAVLVGLAVGVGTAVLAYLAALVVAARRLFGPGRWAGPALLALVGPVAVAGYGAVLLRGLRLTAGGGSVVATLLLVAAVACGPAAFLACGATGRARVGGVAVVAAAAVAAGAAGVVSHAVHSAREAKVVAALPLVLFDGDTADPTYPDWRRDRFPELSVHEAHSFTDRGREGYLKYFTSRGVAFVTMHTDAGPCGTPASGYTCAAAGRVPAGELRLYTRTTPYGSYPRSDQFLVLVYPDGSAVSLNVEPDSTSAQRLDVEQARSVLSTLRRVDRARFEARTASRVTVP